MSYSLPLTSSPLRALFSVEDLVTIADRERRHQLPTLAQAGIAARKMMREDSTVRSVHSICVTHDEHLRLVRFGNRCGSKRLWDFGEL